ncbi:hypothetical protein [Eubacterium barkeri]|uniref:Uncharacterized protein n=1 Tax=Eubacterium barkeri TaxID=1528 RepID=A0A1H3BI46_EUBBA|nr:hypothetical protein [Eubacterium barkeri]SDX41606.1 hypothetical protein SAMN04488579_10289 [Eubacterium barkeri]
MPRITSKCKNKECGNYINDIPNGCRALRSLPKCECKFAGTHHDAVDADKKSYLEDRTKNMLSPEAYIRSKQWVVATAEELYEALK